MRKLMEAVESAQTANPIDTVTVDIPLLIRLLEFSREDAQTDMDLHQLANNLINLSPDGNTLTMADYEELVTGLAGQEVVESLFGNKENRKIKFNIDEGRAVFEMLIEFIEKSDINQVGQALGINNADAFLIKLKEGARSLRHASEALQQ